MSGSSFDLLELLKTLPAEQLAEMGNLIDQAKKKVSDSSKIPVQVDLHIDVNDTASDPKELHAALSKASRGQSLPITIEDLAQLQKAQPALLKWIGASKENAALFAADPIRALSKADVPLNNTLLKKLEHMNRGLPGFTTFAGIPIKSVVLQTKPSAAAPVEKNQESPQGPKYKDDKKGGK